MFYIWLDVFRWRQALDLTCGHSLLSCSVKRSDYLNTFEFLDKLAENLKMKLSSQPKLWFHLVCLLWPDNHSLTNTSSQTDCLTNTEIKSPHKTKLGQMLKRSARCVEKKPSTYRLADKSSVYSGYSVTCAQVEEESSRVSLLKGFSLISWVPF